MHRGYVVEVVSMFKIYKTVTLVKISLESQLVPSATVQRVEIIVYDIYHPALSVLEKYIRTIISPSCTAADDTS